MMITTSFLETMALYNQWQNETLFGFTTTEAKLPQNYIKWALIMDVLISPTILTMRFDVN